MDNTNCSKKDCPYIETNCSYANTANIESGCPKYIAWKSMQDSNKVNNKLIELGIDPKHVTFNDIYKLQGKFTNRFHPISNLSRAEMDRWINEHLVAVDDELYEIRECSKVYDDIIQDENEIYELHKELIDVLHFIMNALTVAQYKPPMNRDILDYLFTSIAAKVDHFYGSYYSNEEAVIGDKNLALLILICKVSDACAEVRQHTHWKHWKKPTDKPTDFNKLHNACDGLLTAFVSLAYYLQLSPRKMKEIYLSKNMENIFRQELGY